MRINLGFFQLDCWKRESKCDFHGSGLWFRIFGYGLHFTNGRPLFSERYGYTRKIKLPFNFRCGFLKNGK